MAVNAAMRIAVLADCHIDHQVNQLDGYEAWLRAADEIATREVSAVVVAGDLFHQWRTNGNALARAMEGLERMASGGAEIVLLAGNHEWIGLPSRHLGHTTLEVFAHTPYVSHVLTSSRLVTLDCGLRLAGLPWQHHADTTVASPADAAASFKEELAGCREPRMLIAHTSVGGTRLLVRGAEMDMAILTNEAMLPLSVLDEPSIFTRTALGHIHRRQSLSDTCGYVGSLDQHSFTDEGQTKGFSIYAWDDAQQRWDEELVPVGVHQFTTLHVDADEQVTIDGEQLSVSDALDHLVRRDPGLPATQVRAVVSGEGHLPPDLPNEVTRAGGKWRGWTMAPSASAQAAATRNIADEVATDFTNESMIATWVEVEGLAPARRALLPRPAEEWLDIHLPDEWRMNDKQRSGKADAQTKQ